MFTFASSRCVSRLSRYARLCLRLIPAVLPAIAGWGCSSYQAPSVELREIRLVDQSDVASRVDVVVEVNNPNNEPMPLHKVSYRLALDDGPSYRSFRYAEATIPQKASCLVTIPVILPRAGAKGVEFDGVDRVFQLNGKLSYRAPGQLAEALFDTGFRVPTTSFATGGTYHASPPSQVTDATP